MKKEFRGVLALAFVMLAIGLAGCHKSDFAGKWQSKNTDSGENITLQIDQKNHIDFKDNYDASKFTLVENMGIDGELANDTKLRFNKLTDAGFVVKYDKSIWKMIKQAEKKEYALLLTKQLFGFSESQAKKATTIKWNDDGFKLAIKPKYTGKIKINSVKQNKMGYLTLSKNKKTLTQKTYENKKVVVYKQISTTQK